VAPQADPEIRRALLEEARDRLRSVRRRDRPEALLAVHSLAASVAAAGLTDLLAVFSRLEGQLVAGETDAIDTALGDVLSALERTERGEDEDAAAELLECFAAEAADHVEVMGQQLDILEDSPEDEEAQGELYRVLHTYKGSAAIVDRQDASRAAHMLEDMLQKVRSGERPLDRPLLDLLRAGSTLLRAIIEEPARAEDHRRAVAALAGAHGAISGDETPVRRRRMSADTAPLSWPPPDQVGLGGPPSDGRRRTERRREAPLVLRVPVEETRGLLVASREASSAASSVQASVGSLRGVVEDLHSTRAALVAATTRDAAPTAEVETPLATDLAAAASAVEFVARQLEHDASRVSRAAGRSRRFVDGMRTTPASWLFDRLVAVAEEAAGRLDKSVSVEVVGEDVEVDRAVAGRILEPLLHIVRNAVAHGCEEPAQRVALGKEPAGRLRLEAISGAEKVTYIVEDDGPGLDLVAIRERLVVSGLRAPEEVEGAAETRLLEWIFLPGLSTTVSADEVSGRGVGLDAVRAAVSRLGGAVSVTTTPGEGTRFALDVPRGIGRIRVLVARLGPLRIAFPVASVVRAEALPKEGITGGRVLVGEGDVPALQLSALLGLRRRTTTLPVAVLVEGDDGLVAVEVERIEGVEEVTAHRMRGLLASFGPYGGVAVTDDGAPMILLDETALGAPPTSPRISTQAPRVLLADDSKTVREMVTRALRGAGYEVDSAANGLEAWQRLFTDRYDLLMTDLEMPRLGGLELVERLRAEPRLARLPVVVLTSRVSDRARARAAELGVRAFVVKPAAGVRLLREVEAALGGR